MDMLGKYLHQPLFVLQIVEAEVLEQNLIVGCPRKTQLHLEAYNIVHYFQHLQEEIYAQPKPPFKKEKR